MAKGDTPPGPFFQMYEELGYMKHAKTKDQYWTNARFYTANVFDADTGAFTAQKDIHMYCDYCESHWTWSHPQVWAFSGIHRYKSGYTGKEGATITNYGLIVETTK